MHSLSANIVDAIIKYSLVKLSADNVHPVDDVPESSYLNSKYWEKYGGNYRLPLTAHHFLEEYLLQ